jgi:phosphoserine aminotransferase
MKATYFTAGPSQLNSNYITYHAEAMSLNLGSLNHRSEGFRKIYQHTDEQLRVLLNLTTNHQIYFAGSATEIWERMILNLVDENSFHLVNGSFSQRFYEFSQLLGKNATAYSVKHGEGFNLSNFKIPSNSELICTTQNETSSGVFLPSDLLVDIKKSNPASLLCTDLVSIAPISNVDYGYVDSSFFSVQKAYGMPPGLGVWIVNDKCIAKAEALTAKGINVGAQNSILSYAKNYSNWETPSTPNVVAIYILGKIAEEMNQKGIEKIRQEIKSKANLVYDFAQKSSKYEIVVTEDKFQSESIIVLKYHDNNTALLSNLKSKGIHVSSGYGPYKNSEIRIANFPATTFEDLEKLLVEL